MNIYEIFITYVVKSNVSQKKKIKTFMKIIKKNLIKTKLHLRVELASKY